MKIKFSISAVPLVSRYGGKLRTRVRGKGDSGKARKGRENGEMGKR
jgi:hypothetical protein